MSYYILVTQHFLLLPLTLMFFLFEYLTFIRKFSKITVFKSTQCFLLSISQYSIWLNLLYIFCWRKIIRHGRNGCVVMHLYGVVWKTSWTPLSNRHSFFIIITKHYFNCFVPFLTKQWAIGDATLIYFISAY